MTAIAPTIATDRTGMALVLGSALFWSFGGTIARFLTIEDSWTVIFWRGFFAGVALVGFLLLRDGPGGTVRLFRSMGLPGLAVAVGFAVACTCFVIALSHTTVANVILIQATVPLLAALMAWVVFRESVSISTWLAIGAVIMGVAIMVSGSLEDGSSWIGNLLAMLIALVFAMTTVVTRRYPDVRMTPAAAVGAFASVGLACTQASHLAVSPGELGLLFVFGAFNLGLGMALFVTGARLIPAALAALLGTTETVFGPLWVALVHGEIPDLMTIIGGGVVLAALVFYLLIEFGRAQRTRAT